MTRKKKYKLLYKIKLALNCSLKELVKLSMEQVDYINHYLKQSSFLEACAGGGKTEVIGIKAAYEIHKWETFNSGIAVVTFTTSAARELNQRVRKFGAVSTELFPHFVGTFDSWLHGFILQPFAHYLTGYAGKDGDKSIRLIDVESSAGFLSNYTTSIYKNGKMIPVKVVDYYYDYTGNLYGNGDITDGLFNSGISAIETKSLMVKKKEFVKAGFATYADIEWLCNLLLAKYPILKEKLAQRFPVIIVDECQDLSGNQINILESLRGNGTNLHLVGDLNQSIYEFRKVNPRDILDYIHAKQLKIKKLTNNYRSCQSIVNIAEKIIGNDKKIFGHETQICQQSCILWQYDEHTFSQLPIRLEQFISSNGIDKTKCVILARGKSTLAPLRTQMEKYSLTKSELFAIAVHNWYKEDRTTDDISNSLFYLGRVLCLLGYSGRGDVRNQYCPEDIQPIEWRLFLKKFMLSVGSIYPYDENGRDLSWTRWIQKLKIVLQPLWPSVSKVLSWESVASKLRSPEGRKDSPVNEACSYTGIQNSFRTTTIHDVKGETFDAVLLLSHHNRQSKGGHFSHWFKEGEYIEEHLRFAYVACSRPKHLLIVATPQLNAADLQKLQNFGFSYQA
jgi:DNA helicase II / ATP-dependent DNA helicase PcrA